MTFKTKLRMEEYGSREWKLLTPLVYDDTFLGETFVVPPDFITDLASIPRIFHFLLPVNDKHRAAAVLHDWLYENADNDRYTRAAIDYVFYRAMLDSGVAKWKAEIIYAAVRLFGGTTKRETENEQDRP